MATLIHHEGGLVYMDGANMNAIAGWVNLRALGVDAVHNNNHKTWSIPHGGGGPGDAIVAVSERLVPFLPGVQVVRTDMVMPWNIRPSRSARCIVILGTSAIRSAPTPICVLLGGKGYGACPLWLYSRHAISTTGCGRFSHAAAETPDSPRMHEFIITLPEATFETLEAVGISRARAIGPFGKLFLDFGYHAPTVSFPEAQGLMIEPTESYTKAELDRFADSIILMLHLINEQPTILQTVPHFTPVDRIDDVSANKHVVVSAL